MMNLLYFIHHPRSFGKKILYKYFQWLPDAIYLRILFYLQMGERLHLKKPRTFSDKIQWLKLYNRRAEYTTMVDKYAVKDYVASIIGEKYIIPTIGVWNRPEDIDWRILPNQFVLKTSNGGGGKGVVICKNKVVLDKENAIKHLNTALKRDIYQKFREWPYKNVPKRVIAEQYMKDTRFEDLRDYKFYCFNGEPRYCQVIKDRTTEETIDFYDMKWNHQEFIGLNPAAHFSEIMIEKPNNFEEMKEIARKLSSGIPFSRVDLYSINHKTYFGEMTFYPRSGFGKFVPLRWNEMLGKEISLN